ncbi:MAG: serine/threonine-protein kinase [Rivularia sp. (in: cyanobacteria)]
MNQTLSGRYRIVQELGRGGFGVTYIALYLQRPGNPKCVVKLFEPAAKDPYTLNAGKNLFDREAEALEKLGNHDQIPRLLAPA